MVQERLSRFWFAFELIKEQGDKYVSSKELGVLSGKGDSTPITYTLFGYKLTFAYT
jgi:hypothetical protein